MILCSLGSMKENGMLDDITKLWEGAPWLVSAQHVKLQLWIWEFGNKVEIEPL